MDAQQLFRAGKLEEAISALGAALRDEPANTRNRTFLFELLCFAGEYDRAEKQLNLLEQNGQKDSLIGVLLYRGALNAERVREEMFEKKTYPKNDTEQGTGQDPISGKLNGKPFSTLTDSDPRIGPRLEVFAAGDYLWISLRDIAAIEMEQPKRLRDLLWSPAKLKTGPNFHSRDLGEILLPVLCPLSFQHPEGEVRLGRVTEWCEDEAGEVSPFGQKTLLVDGEEFPFLEIRSLEIDPQPPIASA